MPGPHRPGTPHDTPETPVTEPTPHQRLTRAGLSHQFADLVLNQHAHQLAEQIRNSKQLRDATDDHMSDCLMAADEIDPKAQR